MEGKKKTILLVEDDSLVASITTEVLTSFQYDVIHVDSGEKALIINFESIPIDLILMDIDLGEGIDGPETARQILEKYYIPVVFHTSHSEKEYVERVKKITRYGYVVKNSGSFVLQSSIDMAFELFDANKKTKAAVAKLEATLDALPDLLLELGLDGFCYDFHSPNFGIQCKTGEQVIGKNIKETLPVKSVEVIMSAVKEAELKGYSAGKQYSIFQKGEIRWYEISVSKKENNYNDQHFVLLRRDITERKKTEEDNYKLSLAVQQSPVSIFITDCSGRIEYVNPKTIKTTGYSSEELLGKRPSIFKSDVTPYGTYKELWETITSGNIWEGVLSNKKKNGELYWEETIIAPIKNKENEITHFIAVKEDITERKQIEEELKFRSNVLDNISYGLILTKKSDNHIIYTNSKFDEMLGYTKGELIGLNIDVVNVLKKESFEEISLYKLEELKKSGYWEGRIKNIKKDGSVFYSYAHITEFYHPLYGSIWMSCYNYINEFTFEETGQNEDDIFFFNI